EYEDVYTCDVCAVPLGGMLSGTGEEIPAATEPAASLDVTSPAGVPLPTLTSTSAAAPLPTLTPTSAASYCTVDAAQAGLNRSTVMPPPVLNLAEQEGSTYNAQVIPSPTPTVTPTAASAETEPAAITMPDALPSDQTQCVSARPTPLPTLKHTSAATDCAVTVGMESIISTMGLTVAQAPIINPVEVESTSDVDATLPPTTLTVTPTVVFLPLDETPNVSATPTQLLTPTHTSAAADCAVTPTVAFTPQSTGVLLPSAPAATTAPTPPSSTSTSPTPPPQKWKTCTPCSTTSTFTTFDLCTTCFHTRFPVEHEHGPEA
ncbi:hypothetical protein HK104_006717, partial [Borealophlyctis nickersoniae]